jgi:hypothetical protein
LAAGPGNVRRPRAHRGEFGANDVERRSRHALSGRSGRPFDGHCDGAKSPSFPAPDGFVVGQAPAKDRGRAYFSMQ